MTAADEIKIKKIKESKLSQINLEIELFYHYVLYYLLNAK